MHAESFVRSADRVCTPRIDISDSTAMTHDDIFFILRERKMIIDFDKVQPPEPTKPDKPKGTASPEREHRTYRSRNSTSWTIRKRSQNVEY